jgi:hypothetical protein
MKTNILVLLSFFISSLTLSAQVAITMDNCPFQIGQEINQSMFTGDIPFPKFSTTGTNNNWDFSALTTTGQDQNVFVTVNNSTLVCPETAPTCTALVLEYDPNTPESVYYTICVLDQDSLSIIGEYGSSLECSMLVNSLTYFKFPLEHGDVDTDYYEFGGGFSYSFNTEYSAWGSLSLPNNVTYNQVALISVIDELYVQYSFMAYVDGQFQVVFQLDSDGFFTIYQNTFELSTSEQSNDAFGIINQGNHQYSSADLLPSDWEVYNALGQRVLSSNQTSNISLDGLTTGAYVIRTTRGNQSSSLKIFHQ